MSVCLCVCARVRARERVHFKQENVLENGQKSTFQASVRDTFGASVCVCGQERVRVLACVHVR